MKVAMNGGLNLSVLDGWWPEGYDKMNGWAIGASTDILVEHQQNELDSQALYSLLETQIAPLFYDRDERELPAQWIKMVKHSMRTLIPRFNTYRMLEEYLDKMYIPAHNHSD
jgi:starch phosphorylase